MIYVSKEVRANGDAGQPRLSRSEIWKGLVMKAENALPFVPGMAKCDVVERTADGLVRDIVFRGEDAREKITFYPEEKGVFLRLSGNVDGFIVNYATALRYSDRELSDLTHLSRELVLNAPKHPGWSAPRSIRDPEQAFMRAMLKVLRDNPDHPFRFLIEKVEAEAKRR